MRLYRPGNIVANRYEVCDVIGIGPVSATYLVREQEGQEVLALKVMNSELTITESEREECANALRKISEAKHPYLREIYEVDTQSSVVFYTTSYHQNGSLRALLRAQNTLRFSEVEGLVHQICRALSDTALPHGGLRPENIMLGAGAIRISDVGLASALPKGSYVGALRQEPTRVYLAPELLQGGEPTQTADVFSLGALCVELLTGQPYQSSALTIAKKLRVNESLDEVLESALSTQGSARISTPQEFAQRLSQVSRLTVFIPRSASLQRGELLQKLKEAASEPEPTPKPQAALKQQAKTTETVKQPVQQVSQANVKTAEIPRPTEPTAKAAAPKPPEIKPSERLSSPALPLPKIPGDLAAPKPPEPKAPAIPAAIAKTTEFPKPVKPESKINIPIRPDPPKLPGMMRLATGEQELVKNARFPESKINIPIRPDPPPRPPVMRLPTGEHEVIKNRPMESPSKSVNLKPEAPKNERAPSLPVVRAMTGEQEVIKPKVSPTPKIPPAETPLDPEPTQVSAKLPDAFVALLAAESEQRAREAREKEKDSKTTQPIDPALVLLRPFDMPTKNVPDPFSYRTNPISKFALPDPPPAPEPTVSTRLQDIIEPPKLPEPTSVYVKNPDPMPEAPETPPSKDVEYPSVDSLDLFVDVDEIEEEDPLNPFADDVPQKMGRSPWPRSDSEDSETTGIRPLPSRRTSALPMQDPGDDLFSSYPEPPPFEPPDKK